MQTLDRDELTIVIEAPPNEVYALVADVPARPSSARRSSTAHGWRGAPGPAVGARFQATNKVSRGRPWKNHPVVVAAEPGREFAFSRTEKFSGTIIWRYRFEPLRTGTRVTESYEVTRPISRLGWFVMERLFGGHDRRGDLRRGMQQTLERLRSTAESMHASNSAQENKASSQR